MNKTDLTSENLQLLINISNDYNILTSNHLDMKKISQKCSEKIFFKILWYSNF